MGEAPIPYLLMHPEHITKMLDPATHFLKSAVELKWALAERGVANLLEAFRVKYPKARGLKAKGRIGEDLSSLKKLADRLEDEAVIKQLRDLRAVVDSARKYRNALAHGKLLCSPRNSRLEVGEGKPNIGPIQPLIGGTMSMSLESKGVAVALEAEKLREMSDQVNKVLSSMSDIYRDQGFTKIRIRTKLSIEDADPPDISFASDRVEKEASLEAVVDLQDISATAPTEFYACPECGQVSTEEFARKCHGMEPEVVETEYCYFCDKFHDKKNLCMQLALVKSFLSGSWKDWEVRRWRLSVEEARKFAEELLKAANQIEGRDDLALFMGLRGMMVGTKLGVSVGGGGSSDSEDD